MSANFAIRLADLRKEKNLSQKEAASCLGVSQALLSHYEKGIRECGLSFIKKACDYYDVTSDYLLGLTGNRHGFNDIYTKNELPSDSELRIKTLFRALVSLCEKLSASGDTSENKLIEEVLLTVYRFALLSAKYGISDLSWFEIDISDGDVLSSQILDRMFDGKRKKDNAEGDIFESEPEYLKTVIKSAEKLIKEKYMNMINPDK